MNYLHQKEDFKTLLEHTSDNVRLPFPIVEKDYWLTFILKNLVNSDFKNEFLFKGGTSLSKIWFDDFGRFSEDIDILLLPTHKTTKRSEQNLRLREFINFVNSFEGLDLDKENSDNLDKNIIGGMFYFNYPNTAEFGDVEGMKSQILLEPGYRGGAVPYSTKSMNSFVENLICEEFKNNLPPELKESMSFEITALNPERILLEKLDAILNLHSKNKLQWGTRHFFDIYNLLTLDCVKSLTREQMNLILDDINKISKEFYGNKNPITIEKIKSCEVFSPAFKDFSTLEKQYVSENLLYYKKQPDLKEILETIYKYVERI